MEHDYTQGFLAKCAEFGLDDSQATELLKQAWISGSVQDATLRGLHNDLLEDAQAGGYAAYLPKDFLADSDNKVGTGIGRWWQGLIHGRSGFRRRYQAEFEAARRKAIAKRDRVIAGLTPEQQKAVMQDIEYNTKLLKDRRNMMSLDPSIRASIMAIPSSAAAAATAPAAPTGVAAPSTPSEAAPINRYIELMEGRLSPPSIAGHALDGKTGLMYRTDGRPLDIGAEYWNAQMNWSKQKYEDWQKSHPKTPPAAAPAAPAPAAPAAPAPAPQPARKPVYFGPAPTSSWSQA